MFYGLLMRHGMVSFIFHWANVFTVAIREVNGVYNNWDSEMDRIRSFPSSSIQYFSTFILSFLESFFLAHLITSLLSKRKFSLQALGYFGKTSTSAFRNVYQDSLSPIQNLTDDRNVQFSHQWQLLAFIDIFNWQYFQLHGGIWRLGIIKRFNLVNRLLTFLTCPV